MARKRICSVDGCGNPTQGAGYCSGHYKRLLRYGDPLGRPKFKNGGKCLVGGCLGVARSKGMCRRHFLRFKDHGDPLAGRTPEGVPEAWLRSHATHDEPGCLIWPFSKGKKYGHVTFDGRKTTPHRAMCELVNGPPPSASHEAAHDCGKGHEGCVHPGHLRWDTSKGNHADRLIHGTHTRGERNGWAKLDRENVREIRRLHGVVKMKEIAERFGVHIGTVEKIIAGRAWAWLD